MTEPDSHLKLVENTKPDKPVKWTDAKKILTSKDPKELLALIKDLYSLNQQNKTFIQTKYSLIDQIKPYKDIIEECISLDYRKPINLAGAKKAISQYRKAVGDPKGILELTVYYVECGNNLTCEYGDINEKFYYSLESMFDNALQSLVKFDQNIINEYLPRLETIVEKADGIGWGYYDTIICLLYTYFPPED